MQLKLDTAAMEAQKPEKCAPEAVARAEPARYHEDGLLDTAVPIMIAAYGAALAIATYTFWDGGSTLLSVAVCAVYIVMFFGVPIVMARIRNRHDARLVHDRREADADTVAVFGGTIGRTQALLQIVIVPLVVVFGFACFSAIWLSVSP